jgi:hypothetical protein
MWNNVADRMSKDGGYVLVSVALTLALLCGFAALAIDIGVFLSARASAQRAADSGALAGAFTFVVNPLAPQPETARQHALEATLRNNILQDMVEASEVSVDVDVDARLVTVDINHNQGTLFARAIGQNDVDIVVRGIAEASPTATGSACSKPWFIPNTILSLQDPCAACQSGELFVANGEVTPFARSQLGTSFTIKPGNPQNALAPGQFYAIAMGDSMGGSDYRTNIATCSPQIIYCQNIYTVEPGNMIGPTKQGVDELIGPSPDIFMDVGAYQRANGTLSDTSPQLISAPLWDECAMVGFCPDGSLPDGGRNVQIPVVGFALIFLEGIQGNDVNARLIGVTACGAGSGSGGGPQPPETGPYSIPVRLVR